MKSKTSTPDRERLKRLFLAMRAMIARVERVLDSSKPLTPGQWKAIVSGAKNVLGLAAAIDANGAIHRFNRDHPDIVREYKKMFCKFLRRVLKSRPVV